MKDGGGCEVGALAVEDGRDENEVAARGDGEEFCEALDEPHSAASSMGGEPRAGSRCAGAAVAPGPLWRRGRWSHSPLVTVAGVHRARGLLRDEHRDLATGRGPGDGVCVLRRHGDHPGPKRVESTSGG